MRPLALCLAVSAAVVSASCGYHVAGHANVLPPAIQTIAIPAFGNGTVQFHIAEQVTTALTREMIQRTRYRIVADPSGADAVLTGALVNFVSYPTTFDPVTGRASGVQLIVYLQVSLRDKTGKKLFDRPNFEVHERYEISVDPKTYFDESSGGVQRLSKDVARSIVSAILENF